jgi:hypothetical protein
MITKTEAMQLKHGDIIYTNFPTKDYKTGKYLPKVAAWRVTSTAKTWKRQPERFRLGLKHGLYTYGEITEENNQYFYLVKPE